MSILIKGLDIPKDEHERITVQIGSDGAVYLVTDFELKAEVYKFNAAEVPEPHGRLIDADKVTKKMKKIATEAWRKKLSDTVEHTLNMSIDIIKSALTVIEAEGKE